jgi:hypothetical protein
MRADSSAVTIIDNVAYSTINSGVRILRVYWPAGMPPTTKTTAVVFIHGGGFWKGDYNNSGMMPSSCETTDTYACWLAENGIPVYDIDYTLVKTLASATDLTINPDNDTAVRSASYRFTSTDVGSAIIVVGGEGWPSAGYTIVGADGSGYAIVDGTPTSGANPNPAKFDLIQGSTMWPAQWQDTTCALSWAADNLGVNYPGDPQSLVLMGHSAGGHLVLASGLIPAGTFPSTCDSDNQRYSIQSILAMSPPSNLRTLYTESETAQQDIRDLLGCVPGTRNCDAIADAASPTSYLAVGQPPVVAFSGALDQGVPPINVQEIQVGYAAIGVTSTWFVEPHEYHDLDAFYIVPCSSDPVGPEPTPCGSAGGVFVSALPFILSPGDIRSHSPDSLKQPQTAIQPHRLADLAPGPIAIVECAKGRRIIS